MLSARLFSRAAFIRCPHVLLRQQFRSVTQASIQENDPKGYFPVVDSCAGTFGDWEYPVYSSNGIKERLLRFSQYFQILTARLRILWTIKSISITDAIYTYLLFQKALAENDNGIIKKLCGSKMADWHLDSIRLGNYTCNVDHIITNWKFISLIPMEQDSFEHLQLRIRITSLQRRRPVFQIDIRQQRVLAEKESSESLSVFLVRPHPYSFDKSLLATANTKMNDLQKAACYQGLFKGMQNYQKSDYIHINPTNAANTPEARIDAFAEDIARQRLKHKDINAQLSVRDSADILNVKTGDLHGNSVELTEMVEDCLFQLDISAETSNRRFWMLGFFDELNQFYPAIENTPTKQRFAEAEKTRYQRKQMFKDSDEFRNLGDQLWRKNRMERNVNEETKEELKQSKKLLRRYENGVIRERVALKIPEDEMSL